MVRQPIAFALASLLLVPMIAACTPVPSKSGEGEKTASEAKPEDVCKHVREVADVDTDDAAILDQVERECVETLTGVRTRYETFTTCIGLAADANAVHECEKGLAKPRSLLASAGPSGKLDKLCDHVISLLGPALGEAGQQMGPAELDKLRTECIDGAGAQLELKGAEAFDKEAECILAAQNLEGLQACGV